jgi:hypothetical protein
VRLNARSSTLAAVVSGSALAVSWTNAHGALPITPPPPCTEPATNCHAADIHTAYNSTVGQYTVSEDFAVAHLGGLTDVCFWGVYSGTPTSDDFTISYFTDVSGLPGTLIASFSQSGGSLTVASQANGAEYTYAASHAPVPVSGGVCYFIQITNRISGGSWYWEQSFAGNHYAIQNNTTLRVDLSLCLNQPLADDQDCNPRGRCCMPDGSCQVLNAPGCAAAHGAFDATHHDCSAYDIATGTDAIVPGTTDIGNHCGNCTTAITMPFPVTVFGTTYTTANVSSNGNIQLVTNNPSYDNVCLPNPSTGVALHPHWAGLQTNGTDRGIFTSTTGISPNRVFNIEWRATYSGDPGAVNFEVRLFENDLRIEFIYGAVAGGGGSATVGIDNGTNPSLFECNSGGLTPGLKLTITARTGVVCTPTCQADFNSDGAVNIQDFLAFLAGYAASNPRCDIDGDGQVNLRDFLAYLALFARGC